MVFAFLFDRKAQMYLSVESRTLLYLAMGVRGPRGRGPNNLVGATMYLACNI